MQMRVKPERGHGQTEDGAEPREPGGETRPPRDRFQVPELRAIPKLALDSELQLGLDIARHSVLTQKCRLRLTLHCLKWPLPESSSSSCFSKGSKGFSCDKARTLLQAQATPTRRDPSHAFSDSYYCDTN
ncbi:hypothetical protein SKAU_G00348930 [Synaphobranchus kaupii]|uniref:Uncharacterized protein n=1 Tax=Synaphobranchus kaupii TaxID=118154 RepID=A0A9Q1IH16_SYNKA|nr:hypothetical protein SKAU_G00348930 [Synaphobranchus kaupii]